MTNPKSPFTTFPAIPKQTIKNCIKTIHTHTKRKKETCGAQTFPIQTPTKPRPQETWPPIQVDDDLHFFSHKSHNQNPQNLKTHHRIPPFCSIEIWVTESNPQNLAARSMKELLYCQLSSHKAQKPSDPKHLRGCLQTEDSSPCGRRK